MHMVEIPLIRAAVLYVWTFAYVLAFRWGDTASVHASSWSPAPTAAVKFPLLLRGLRSHCACVSMCKCVHECVRVDMLNVERG